MALIPPSFLDSVVALGMQSQDKKVQFIGTGFMYGYPTGETNDKGPTYWTFLVTNRHVVAKAAERGSTIHARFNRPMGAESHTYPLPLKEPDGSLSWTTHEKADIAVLQINADRLQADGIQFFFFPSDVHAFSVDQLREIDVSEGDGVYVLGFPLGEAGDERNYAIVRQGIIARARDWIRGNASVFLIDASVYPGNSGGPVLLKPEAVSVPGTKPNTRCGLIGMVSSYIPYREVAISTQTDRPRMIFEENSGLGVVVPYDQIRETVELAINQQKLRDAKQ